MRILPAQIKGGAVYVDNVKVSGADILSEGKTDSKGYFLIDKDLFLYITKTSGDLIKTLDLMDALITKLSSDILPANQGGAITAGSYQADLTKIKQDIATLKGKLL